MRHRLSKADRRVLDAHDERVRQQEAAWLPPEAVEPSRDIQWTPAPRTPARDGRDDHEALAFARWQARQAAYRTEMAEAWQRIKAANRDITRIYGADTPQERPCAVCGQPMLARRITKRTCSDACRLKQSRARRQQKAKRKRQK
jgi:predicted nucleic acid-binding Zn ribbon protein